MTIISNNFDYLHFTECEFKDNFEIKEIGYQSTPIESNTWKRNFEFKSFLLAKHHIKYVKKLSYLLNSKRENYIITGAEIVIVTHQLGILPGHPLNTTDDVIFLPQCNLRFNGVKRSVRHVTRYVEELPETNKFKPEEARKETVTDVLFPTFDRPVTLFEIEGIFKNPLRWVDWEIESVSFELEVSTLQDALSQNYSKSVSGERDKS